MSRVAGKRARMPLSAVALAVVAALAGAPSAVAGEQAFTAPGSYSFTVPDGVTSISVVAIGASGEGANLPPFPAGLGARVQGDLPVTPGLALQVNVGTVGGGGAAGGGGGGDGGGASDVRVGSDLGLRLVVAGGGGGTGSGSGRGPGGNAGEDGDDGAGLGGLGGTAGGTLAGGNGGAGGSAGGDGDPGVFGAGGDGGPQDPGGSGVGGGGGDGWFGGGGGGGGAFAEPGGGGGGGSNHTASTVTNVAQGLATSIGDGSVVLSWADPPAAPSNAFAIGEAKRNKKKGTAELTVSVPGPGTVALSGEKVKPAAAQTAGAGDVVVSVKAAGAAKARLKSKGKAKVAFDVTFTPAGGVPSTQSTEVKLVRK